MSRSNYQKKTKRGGADSDADSHPNSTTEIKSVPSPIQETNTTNPTTQGSQSNEFYQLFSGVLNNKNVAIIILFVLLVLSFLGVNILLIIGSVFEWIIGIIGPFITKVLSYIGYATGSILNKTADVVSDTAKTGIDIADGTVHSVGNLLRNGSNADVDVAARIKMDNVSYDLLPTNTSLPSSTPQELSQSWSFNSIFSQNVSLDDILNTDSTSNTISSPSPDTSDTAIQSSLTGNKSSWCLTGQYNGVRGCVEISDQDKCMSGQIYPSQAQCLNVKPKPIQNQVMNQIQSQSQTVQQIGGQQQKQLMPPVPPAPLIPSPPVYNGVPPFPPGVMVPPLPQLPNPNTMPNGFAQVPSGLPPLPGKPFRMDGPPIVAGPPNYLNI
jgi:hypothetical protein